MEMSKKRVQDSKVTTKRCTKCGKTKPIALFHKRSKSPCKYQSRCKECRNQQIREARKTCAKTFLSESYTSIKNRTSSKKRPDAYIYKGLPIMSRQEFMDWATEHPDFTRLFKEWTDSGHIYALIPVPDRIHPLHGYVKTNLQWVTLSENTKRANAWQHHKSIV